MASLRELSNGKLEAYKVDPREIEIREGFNYRDTTSPEAKKHIAFLKESIRERGVDEPIWVENSGEGFHLIDGECRLLALRQLWDEGVEVYVPTIVYKGDEAAILAKSLIANGGLPPNQMEFGKAVERLLAFGWSRDRIATLLPPHLGLGGPKAKRYISDALELQQAPLAVKKAVKEGVDGVKVSTSLALAATRKNRMHAEEMIERETSKAKAAGKTVANRPKGAGAKTKAAADLMSIGDRMAGAILNESGSVTTAERMARAWQKARE